MQDLTLGSSWLTLPKSLRFKPLVSSFPAPRSPGLTWLVRAKDSLSQSLSLSLGLGLLLLSCHVSSVSDVSTNGPT